MFYTNSGEKNLNGSCLLGAHSGEVKEVDWEGMCGNFLAKYNVLYHDRRVCYKDVFICQSLCI